MLSLWCPAYFRDVDGYEGWETRVNERLGGAISADERAYESGRAGSARKDKPVPRAAVLASAQSRQGDRRHDESGCC